MTYTTRFAPSPTGPLHLGHAYSAVIAYRAARAQGGRFLLRLEDLDASRCRPEWARGIEDDLGWLGLAWDLPVLRQSDNLPAYRAALDRLSAAGLVYPCRCRRADIRAALSAPQEGAAAGPDGPIYPGTCRNRKLDEAAPGDALRLDMARAVRLLGAAVTFTESGAAHAGSHRLEAERLRAHVGDVVLARRDGAPAYHLAVTVDDAAQGVSEVIRGEDLFEATQIHVLLQQLLGFEVPRYHHHALIRDAAGKRLAKRDDARAIALFRAEGASPAEVLAMVGLSPSGP